MSNLELAVKKYNLENSVSELIEALHTRGGLPLSSNEYSQFQEFITDLIKIKSNSELTQQLEIFDTSLNLFAEQTISTMENLSKDLEEFTLSTSKSSKVLNWLTFGLMLATIVQAIVTISNIWKG